VTDDPALDTFFAECQELLSSMESVLLRCEQGDTDPEAINELFRAAHTIKGSAGLFGLDSIVAFTHVVESVLDRARADRTPIGRVLAAALLECRDHIQMLVDRTASGAPAEDAAVQESGARVHERLLAASGFSFTATVNATAAAPAATAARTAEIVIDGDDSLRIEANSWHISVRFATTILKNGMDPLSFCRYLTTFGTITGLQIVDDALPALENYDPEDCYLGFEIGFETDADKSRIESAFEFVRDDCRLRILPPRAKVSDFVSLIRDLPEAEGRLGELLVKCGTLTARELASCLQRQDKHLTDPGGAPRIGEMLIAGQLVQPAVVAAAVQQQSEARATRDAKTPESRTIRVDGDKLDRLIDLIGELVIAGAATGSTARAAGLPALNESALQLAAIVEEVRDQALKLRMVQIGATFTRFQRVVRDVAHETGKDIALETKGAETELDRQLVEGMADPLTHLVRNAIDHGIEKPDVRLARGKPQTGVVSLSAHHEAGSVVIEIADDGGGLNRQRILEKATERGLIDATRSLTDGEIYALIFEPGFSTAEKVTNLSGRGVGMDVVKRNITALRGTVEVQSRPGLGTLVRIRLPLTLAIIDGFQVGVGRSSFVIPLNLVEECVEADRGGGVDDDAGHINLHGSVLPLIRLREMFAIEGRAGRRQSVVVVRCAGKSVGIVVDDLMGELQAVIKPLSKLFSQLQGIGGSTILGTGRVALILDIPGLVERTQTRHEEAAAGSGTGKANGHDRGAHARPNHFVRF
jgi:two-component system chemotaxis sensor kinase CheA